MFDLGEDFIPEISYHEARSFLWENGDLSYLLWDQQIPIYNGVRSLPNNVTEAVILCSRQYGKSQLATILATEDCIQEDDCCVPIMGPTAEQTRDIINPRMEKIKRVCPLVNFIRRAKSEDKWYVGNSEIVIGGFDINSSAQRGKTIRRNIYIEEVVDSHPDDFLISMRSDLGPALTHSTKGKIVYVSTLPKIPDHPFITDVIPKAKLKNAFYSYDINANTKLSTEQRLRCADLAGCKINEETGEILEYSIDYRREYLNEIVRDSSAVAVPEFVKARHVKEFEFPYHANWCFFLDFGGVADPTICQLAAYDFYDNTDLIWDERWFSANTPTKKIIEECDAMQAGWNIEKLSARIADAPGQIRVDLAAEDWPVLYPSKSDWQANVNRLNGRFRANRMVIHPRCKLTITTLESGQLNKQRTDFGRTIALGHCEAIASLMYGTRHIDRNNPFPEASGHKDAFFDRRKKESPMEKIGQLIHPVTFNPSFTEALGSKKFGKFRGN